ncbi:putative alkaline shock family protein YloU [Nocardiopsis sp. Huas11]|uniref:Asp23/Gls24 family envelope stress response protein n=1 Tax=Nocardiopsis sp. Huas11 TaxID=2183912 RepID=UPI000EAB7727|nr:Asp23/Gls24 family envelope stress response protein [Nocardiopsis sp. Huas11]RKS10477.1 putative alkaline shock family protein YloU [Nocardiopsis sp. Huas11]
MAGTRTDAVPRQRVDTEPRGRTGRLREGGPARDPGGRTEIASGVIEKAAARAVSEVDGARAIRARPARARTSGDVVLLRLRIAVRYPLAVREVAGRVREHVKDRVEWTTGRTVHHIDIEIAELVR